MGISHAIADRESSRVVYMRPCTFPWNFRAELGFASARIARAQAIGMEEAVATEEAGTVTANPTAAGWTKPSSKACCR